MKTILGLLIMMVGQFHVYAQGAELALSGYQRPDGAITTYLHGDSVDPYFASNALLAAQDAGMSTSVVALPWIAWLLGRQQTDGRFDRYCWRECGAANRLENCG